jgi:hypothetical protein
VPIIEQQFIDLSFASAGKPTRCIGERRRPVPLNHLDQGAHCRTHYRHVLSEQARRKPPSATAQGLIYLLLNAQQLPVEGEQFLNFVLF